MADPKYENLPGIAYDQPDVYECGDLPEADQPEVADEDNECIEQLHLSVRDSFNKFKGKFVADNVDFSDRLSRKARTGYRVGEWSLAASGDVETPEEHYQRLRCEFAELVEQVAARQSNASGDGEKEEMSSLSAQIQSTKKVLEELKLDEGETIDPKAQQLQELLMKSGGKKSSGRATAELKMKPECALAQSTRVAQLEHRLHQLEAAAGVRDDDAFRRLQAATGEATLCGAAATLAARASLLRPAELAAAEVRVGNLLANMDAIKAAVSPANPERDAKINELYKMLKQIDGISHSELLERMEALESLHNQASNFGKSLSELEALQSTISSGVQNNKALLQGVQEVFAHNVDSIQKEIKKLDERISKLKA